MEPARPHRRQRPGRDDMHGHPGGAREPPDGAAADITPPSPDGRPNPGVAGRLRRTSAVDAQLVEGERFIPSIRLSGAAGIGRHESKSRLSRQ